MTTRTLAFLGDVMLGRGVDEVTAACPPEQPWGTTLEVLKGADAVLANLECAITDHARPWTRTRKVFHFRARPHAIAVLRAAGIRYVSLANNHVLDFETEGLLDTVAYLDQAGIAHAGAGRTLDEARRPALVDVGELKVGFMALTDNEPPFAATAGTPGVWHTPIATTAAVLDPIAEGVAALRRAGARIIVLSVHWGPNMVEVPPNHHRRFAEAVIGLGVDIVHGHSAHLFQGVAVVGRGLALFDTGDFLDDYAVDPILRNDRSFIFLVDVEGGRLARLRLHPVTLSFARTDLATGAAIEEVCGRMQGLSAVLGTRLERCGDRLELVLDGGPPCTP